MQAISLACGTSDAAPSCTMMVGGGVPMGYRFRPSVYYTSGPVRRPLRRRRRSKYTKAPTAQKQSCWLPLRHDVFTQPRWFADVRHRLERAQWESDICLGERGAAGRLCLVHRPAARRLSEPELAVSRRTRDCARARRISSAWNRQRLAHEGAQRPEPRRWNGELKCTNG